MYMGIDNQVSISIKKFTLLQNTNVCARQDLPLWALEPQEYVRSSGIFRQIPIA